VAYWRIEFPEPGTEPVTDPERTAQTLREQVIAATRLRFTRSDVPVGAYLSGGLDSSIIAAVIRRYTDVPLHTFSLRFTDSEFDEGQYQKEMSAALGSEHHDILVSPADIAGVFPQVAWHVEAPILRAAPAPLYLLSKLVADSGFKVVVTGEGADEVFGGYDIFREAQVRQFWARDPDSARRAAAVGLLYPWMARSPGQLPAFARSFFGRNLDPADLAISHRPRWDSTAALKGMLTADVRQAATAGDPGAALVAAMPAAAKGWDPLRRAQWLEMTTLLAGYILASQGDRMLMANAVEGRFPFLDANVVASAGSLPAWHKLFGMEEKYLLKRAFADLVPETIRHRPKQPYRAPDAQCFFDEATPDWFRAVTSPAAVRAAGVFEPTAVAALLAKGARTRGSRMSNTDNMRTLAVVSTQLIHSGLISGARPGATHHCAVSTVAVDRLTDSRDVA
jgi:asparagine synthase (glutamine-hydrolysing)